MEQQSNRLGGALRRTLGRAAGAGALGLCCALAGVMAQGAETTARESVLQLAHRFDIPAQTLSGALIAFGQQSGLQLTLDSALLENRLAPAITGSLTSEQALEALLRGSGIGWSYQYGNIIFHALHSSGGEALELGNTVVLGAPLENAFQGETVIDRRAIEAFPGSNGDITTLLRMHPSVQFSGSQQSSRTPGEIEPADISINGAKFYQNNFMIDGISINNDLDPGQHGYGETRQFDAAPSRSHGIALDADLLQEVRVYDSNVPAEYGGFNGGVVDAITRQPTQDLHGKVSASMTRSEWTRYHIRDEDQESFEASADEQDQPEFSKLTVRGTLEGHVTETFGALINFSQKRSEIPLNAYENNFNSPNAENRKEQTRRLDNYLIKGYWDASERLTLDASFTYAPGENYYFEKNRINSGFTTTNGGYQSALKAIWSGDNATWTHKLSFASLDSSRDADADEVIFWYYSQAKNWGNPNGSNPRSTEGSFGSLEQNEKSLVYSLKSDWLPVSFAGLEHNFTSGLELSRKDATWERPDTVTSYSLFTRDNGTACSAGDRFCSVSPLLNGNTRQWVRSGTIYEAGTIELTETKYALFLQDKLQLGKLGLRPGLRLEGDDYMDKKTLAPRFAGDYDVFGDRSTVLIFGANRYYGRNLFKYRLADGRGALNTTFSRTAYNGTWTYRTQRSTNEFTQLDIPYDDELTLGIDQRWLDTNFSLKYVHRKGKDKIVRASARVLGLSSNPNYMTEYFRYTNEGYSENDTVTLSITPQQDMRWLGTRTSLQFAFDWSQTRDGYGSYDSALNADQLDDDDVLYDGKLMKFSELPAQDFNRPWTARMTAITEIPQWNLTLSNFLRYRGPYKQIVDTNEEVLIGGDEVAVYDVAEVSGAPTWDMRAYWEIPTAPEQALFLAVDITNVADRVNEIVSSSGSTSYEVGRQYWLEVGYRF